VMISGTKDYYFFDNHKCLLEDAHMGLLSRMVTWMKNLSGVLMNYCIDCQNFFSINTKRKNKRNEAYTFQTC
jgi:hypothetical protein